MGSELAAAAAGSKKSVRNQFHPTAAAAASSEPTFPFVTKCNLLFFNVFWSIVIFKPFLKYLGVEIPA